MSKSLLLCQGCLSWVMPREDRCPQCSQVIDPSTPDPPLYRLQETLGRVVGRVGEVRIRRKHLPDRGTLYATTRGLLFLPHEEYEDLALKPVGRARSLLHRIWRSVVAAIRLPFASARRGSERSQPRLLRSDQSHLLAQILMEDPGVFFVANSSIRRSGRRLGRWMIWRSGGPCLRLRPETDAREFFARMQELSRSPARRPASPHCV